MAVCPGKYLDEVNYKRFYNVSLHLSLPFPNSQRVLICKLFTKTNMVMQICFEICNLQDNLQHDTSFCTQMGAIPSNQETGCEYKVKAHSSMPAGSLEQKKEHSFYNRIYRCVKIYIFCFFTRCLSWLYQDIRRYTKENM